MKLSNVERVMMSNQFRILAKLDPQGGRYAEFAEIVESGYEGLYDRVLEGLSKPLPAEVSDEVFEIFDMYRSLERAYEAKIPMPTEGRPQFAGFDGNNDRHYGVAHFILQELGLYAEQQGRPINSHSQAELHIYRRMLAVWKKIGKPYPLTEQQVKEIVGAL
jgi:uncharacterized protein YfbU (UPF0304 family)